MKRLCNKLPPINYCFFCAAMKYWDVCDDCFKSWHNGTDMKMVCNGFKRVDVVDRMTECFLTRFNFVRSGDKPSLTLE